MAWRLANSLTRLRDQVNGAYPNRNKASDGTIGDAAHSASASDHNPNPSGVVCALDLTHHAGYFDAHALADRLRLNRHPALKYIISNGRICGAWTGWSWWAYNGSNPHSRHIHVSVGVGPDGRSSGPYDDTSNWNIGGGSSAPAPAPRPEPVSPVKGSVTVTVDTLMVRSAPNTSAPLAGSQRLSRGTVVGYTAVVGGQSVGGNGVWLRSVRGNYFWSGGTSYVSPPPVHVGTATVTVPVINVRSAPTTGAPLSGSRQLTQGQTFSYNAKVVGQNVGGNNIWYRSTKGNYVWSGGVRG